MKIAKDKDAKFFTNIENSSDFKIKTSPKAFHILSNLYKNNIRAIIRELSCNAIDAHRVKPNKDHPVFDVFLPTLMEPKFYIEDYGIGMTEKELNTIYPVYFESTKEDNNRDIGGFGLGSKTPFSYTKQFTVISSKNGKKTTALVYLNDEKLPKISIIQSVPCDKTGTRIEFAVNADDIEHFYNEAISIFLFLPMFPNIIHGKKTFTDLIEGYLEFPQYMQLHNKINKQVQYNNFTMDELEYIKSRYDELPIIIMGGVVYPVEVSELFTSLHDKNTCSSNREIFKEGLKIIYAPIGALSVDLSREKLLYDKNTTVFLEDTFNNFLLQFFNVFNDNKTPFEIYNTICNSIIGNLIRETLIGYFYKENKNFQLPLENDLKAIVPFCVSESTFSNILKYAISIVDFNDYLHNISKEKKFVTFFKSKKEKKFLKGYESLVNVNILNPHRFNLDTFFQGYTSGGVITTASTEKYWDTVVLKKNLNKDSWEEQSKKVLQIAKNYFTRSIYHIFFIHFDIIKEIAKFGFPIEETPFDLVKPQELFGTTRHNNKNISEYDAEPVFQVRKAYKNTKLEESKSLFSLADLMNKKINRVFYLVSNSYKIYDLDFNISLVSKIKKRITRRSTFGLIDKLHSLHENILPIFENDYVVIISFDDFKHLKLWENSKFIDLVSFTYSIIKENFNKLYEFITPIEVINMPNFLKQSETRKTLFGKLKAYKDHETTVFYKTLQRIDKCLEKEDDSSFKKTLDSSIIQIAFILDDFVLNKNIDRKELENYLTLFAKKQTIKKIDFSAELKKYRLLGYFEHLNMFSSKQWLFDWVYYIALEDKLTLS